MEGWKIFQDTKTLDLITFFQDDSEDLSLRDDALRALIFRFRGSIIKPCERFCQWRGYDKDVAREIIKRTFKKYEKSRGFKITKQRTSCVNQSFIFYLTRIAKNELNDYYKEEQKREKGQLYTGTERIVTSLPPVEYSKLSPKSKLIHKTIMDLPEDERTVFLTYTTHERDGVNLPKKLLQELRRHLKCTSQNTIRSHKKRATDKIKAAKTLYETFKGIS